MSQNGRSQEVRRLTGQEVYNDAARILEELLEKRNEQFLRLPGQIKQKKVNPRSENEIVDEGFKDSTARARIPQGEDRKSVDKELDKDDNLLLENSQHQQRLKGEHHRGSESSVDTDYDQSDTSEKRRKKSLFKRAAERLRQTFRHHEKEGFIKSGINVGGSSPYKKQKVKSKPTVEISHESESYHHKDATNQENRSMENVEKSPDSRSSVRTAKKSPRVQGYASNQDGKEVQSSDLHKSNGARACGKNAENEKHGTPQPSPSILESDRTRDAPPPPPLKEQNNNRSILVPLPPQQQPSKDHIFYASDDLVPSSRKSAHHLSSETNISHHPQFLTQSRSLSSSQKSLHLTVATTQGLIIEATSTSSCCILQSGDTSDGSAANVLTSIKSNVLDSPGEDIEYMDNDMPVTTNNSNSAHSTNRGPVIFGSQGNMRQPADTSSSSVHLTGFEVVGRVIATQEPDGGTEMTASVRTVVVPTFPDRVDQVPVDCDSSLFVLGAPQEAQSEQNFIVRFSSRKCSYSAHSHACLQTPDCLDGPMGELPAQPSGADREVLYGKIALKLIELADTYSTALSDQEKKGAAAIQQPSLSDLEKEIIACLRKSGDRSSKQLEMSFEGVAQETTKDAYQRFHSTVQNSMGSELSWDQLAFLFYTTKGVVSAVGTGSRKAHQMKEFTLQYISDTFASWIMEQGGFDSVLSAGESDFDID